MLKVDNIITIVESRVHLIEELVFDRGDNLHS